MYTKRRERGGERQREGPTQMSVYTDEARERTHSKPRATQCKPNQYQQILYLIMCALHGFNLITPGVQSCPYMHY